MDDLGVKKFWDFPGRPVVETLSFHCRGHGVEFLVRELRSYMLCAAKKKKKREISPSDHMVEVYSSMYFFISSEVNVLLFKIHHLYVSLFNCEI